MPGMPLLAPCMRSPPFFYTGISPGCFVVFVAWMKKRRKEGGGREGGREGERQGMKKERHQAETYTWAIRGHCPFIAQKVSLPQLLFPLPPLR